MSNKNDRKDLERTSETAKESKVIEMKPRESTQPQPESTSQTKVEPTPSGSKEPVALTNRGNQPIERRASFPGTGVRSPDDKQALSH